MCRPAWSCSLCSYAPFSVLGFLPFPGLVTSRHSVGAAGAAGGDNVVYSHKARPERMVPALESGIQTLALYLPSCESEQMASLIWEPLCPPVRWDGLCPSHRSDRRSSRQAHMLNVTTV